MFSVLIGLAAGLKVIVTSSSDSKLEKLKGLGDIHGINYETTPDVAAEALRLTDGKGVDYIVNNVGLTSLPSNLQMVRQNGSVALVGFLGGFEADWSPSIISLVMFKAAKLQ